jgi:hypothetical protein
MVVAGSLEPPLSGLSGIVRLVQSKRRWKIRQELLKLMTWKIYQPVFWFPVEKLFCLEHFPKSKTKTISLIIIYKKETTRMDSFDALTLLRK